MEPTTWLAVCDEVIDENIRGLTKRAIAEAEFCIAEKRTVSDSSALEPYQDPIDTIYYSTYDFFNNTTVHTQTVDFMTYQGNPSGASYFPLGQRRCVRDIGKSPGGRSIEGACGFDDRILIHGTWFTTSNFLSFDREKMELTFEQVEQGNGFPGLEPRFTAYKAKLRCHQP